MAYTTVPVPPVEETVILPVFAPLQRIFVVESTVNDIGKLLSTVTCTGFVHPLVCCT